jgi:hypothetical protein
VESLRVAEREEIYIMGWGIAARTDASMHIKEECMVSCAHHPPELRCWLAKLIWLLIKKTSGGFL